MDQDDFEIRLLARFQWSCDVFCVLLYNHLPRQSSNNEIKSKSVQRVQDRSETVKLIVQITTKETVGNLSETEFNSDLFTNVYKRT